MRRREIVALLAIPVLLSGCYGKKMLREPVTIEEIASDIGQIREHQTELSASMRDLETQVAGQGDAIQKLKAENQYLWQELDNRLLAIDAKLQDAIGQKSGYSRGGAYWAGDARPTPPEQPSGLFSDPGADTPTPPVETAEGETGTTPEPSPEATPSAPGDRAKQIYDQAYLDFTRGNYSLAILGFNEFLRRDPESDLVDNARYWIGESYYAQGDYRQSIEEFQKLAAAAPSGDKAAAAVLKIGFGYLQIDEPEKAREAFQRVISGYPASEESRLARDKLRQLD